MLIIVIAALLGVWIGISIKKSTTKKNMAVILNNPSAETEMLLRNGVQMHYKNAEFSISDAEEKLLYAQEANMNTGKYPVALVYKSGDSDLLLVTPGYTGMWTASPPLSSLMQFEGNGSVTIITRKLMSAPFTSAKTTATRYQRDLLGYLQKK